ncbi:KGG domain-containing protein [Caenimonas aquaedulcis]|uniref:General stress protein n=1 Tax=Caenimonas aquaedulcis TaxID=2793270 RepID=A0A931MEX2_9BURK|nr:general stress protein [Caenimonas aquaedulcis]
MQEIITTAAPQEQRRPRGFAAMSPEKKREIASLGGRAAHASGRAHQFSSEEARAAGKKRHQRAESPST